MKKLAVALGVVCGFGASGYILFTITRKSVEAAAAVHTHEVIILSEVPNAGVDVTKNGVFIQDPFSPHVRMRIIEKKGNTDAADA